MTSRRAPTVDLEEQLALALERIAELGRQLARAREESAERDATLRALRETWSTVEGRTLRHEASLDAVRALASTVATLEQRVEQESQLRRDALNALGQGVARDRDVAGAVVEQLEALESRLDEARLKSQGAGAQGRPQIDVARDLDARVGRVHDRLDALEQRVAADRDSLLATVSAQSGLEARVADLTAGTRDLAQRLREAQGERQALGEAVAALQAAGRHDAELRDLLDQQRSLRQRLEERLMALDDGMREVARVLLDASEQRAQLKVQVTGLDARVTDLTRGVEADRELLSARFRALAELEDRAGQRTVAELERQSRERRETLNRLDEATEQATRGVPL